MEYCIHCGTQLAKGSKFCQKCGKPVCSANSNGEAKRVVSYEGRVYKCPNCGEALRSFVRNCPACGLELRGTKPVSSAREFALKLEAIEARREVSAKKSIWARRAESNEVSGIDAQKVSLIQSFSIPNTKEDILEFMILATANVNFRVYDSMSNPSKSDIAVNDAWISKIKQVYDKAKLTYGTDSDFQQIEALYSRHIRDIKKEKKKIVRKWILYFTPVWIWLVALLLLEFQYYFIGPGVSREEIARLEAIESEAISALEGGEYKRALLNAEALFYDPKPRSKDYKEIKRQWDVRRELLIDKIIDEAEENGIHLERTAKEEAMIEDKKDNYREQGERIADGAERFVSNIDKGINTVENGFDSFDRFLGLLDD